MAVYRGNNVRLDYGHLELTEELEEALSILDDSCRGGSGGTYEIYETDVDGADWEAVPVDGPYDTLYFVEGDWTESPDEDEDEEEYDEDEEHDAQSLGPDPAAY
jgi:hypothetical protein